MPECSICFQNKINYQNKCYECKKSICDECFKQIGNLKCFSKDDEYDVFIICECPFCRTKINKNIHDVDNKVTTKVIVETFKKSALFIEKLENDNDKLVEQIDMMNHTITYLENLKEQFLRELNFIPKKKNEKSLSDIIKMYENKSRKTIKLEELKKFV